MSLSPQADTNEAASGLDVVVVSYNSRATLRSCVEPLARAADVNVIVVDNASEDDSLETVRDLPLTTVAADENRGFSAGCNLGWRAGDAPAVLFLNPDAQASAEAVLTLRSSLGSAADVGVVGPRIVGEQGGLEFSIRRFPTLRSTYAQALFLHRVVPAAGWSDELVRNLDAYEESREVDWVSGACFVTRRSLLELLDGLDEGFFMYCEDTDYCRRVHDAGFRVCFDPVVTVRHLGGRSAPRPALLPVLAESRRRYAHKHLRAGSALLMRLGIALGALTHFAASRGGPEVRRGQLRALAAVLRPEAGRG